MLFHGHVYDALYLCSIAFLDRVSELQGLNELSPCLCLQRARRIGFFSLLNFDLQRNRQGLTWIIRYVSGLKDGVRSITCLFSSTSSVPLGIGY